MTDLPPAAPPPIPSGAEPPESGRLSPDDRALAILVAVCAGMSGAALVLEATDVIGMPFTISFLALPAALVIIGLAAWFGKAGKFLLLRRIWVGLVAGLLATLVYDVVRLVVVVVTPTDFDPFRAHRPFGALMLDTDPGTTAALVSGWTYHFWNGISFAIMFTVLFGGARWYWALVWAMVLEIATLSIYPQLFDITLTDAAFVSVSLIGHAFYGITLGILARNWLGEAAPTPWTLWKPSLGKGLS